MFVTSKGNKKIVLRVMAAAWLLAVIGVACGGSDSGDGPDASTAGGGGSAERLQPADGELGYDSVASQPRMAARAVSDESGADSTLVAQNDTGTAARLPQMGPSVIKTATISLGIADDDLDDAVTDAIAIAGKYGGFVLTSQVRGGDEGGTLTMRVPATRFESALTELEDLGRVRNETITGDDVGQEFVDLGARLRNWQAQEAVLLDLMTEATTINESIRVQNELSRVQLEIEQLRGRLNFLRDQTSFGTITVRIGPLVPPKPDAPSEFARAWERAVELMQAFVTAAILTTGVLLPLAVLSLLVYVIFRGIKPRLSS